MLCHLFHLLFKAECDMQTTHCLVYSVYSTVRLYMYKLSAATANQSGDTNTVRWLHFVHLASYTPHSKCSEHLAYIGMRLRHNTTCAVHIEDCGGMVVVRLSWLNGKALAAQAKFKVVWLPAAVTGLFTLLYFGLITSKFLSTPHSSTPCFVGGLMIRFNQLPFAHSCLPS